MRQLACKVEEIHTTLRKHLAKEEEQLVPLLLQHFTFPEQAELVAQFLCCIPLVAVDAVLAWLRPTVPDHEQEHLLEQVDFSSQHALGNCALIISYNPASLMGFWVV